MFLRSVTSRVAKNLQIIGLCVAIICIQTACRSFYGSTKADATRPDEPNDTAREVVVPDTPGGGDLLDDSGLWAPDQRVGQARFHYLLGELMLARGDINAANDLLSSAYSLDPVPFLGVRSIIAKGRAGQVDEAAKESERLVLIYPQDADARILNAEILARKGDIDGSVTQLKAAVKNDPANQLANVMLIELLVRQGKQRQAIAAAEQFTKRNGKVALGWSILSRLKLLAGQKKEMLRHAKRAFTIDSSADNALLFAVGLELNGKSKEAIRYYELAYKAQSSSEQLTGKLVDLYRQAGNLEEALKILSEVEERNPKRLSSGLSIQRVAILWELKRDQEALEILERLSGSRGSDDRPELVATLLGYGYERLGRFDEALIAYEKVPGDFRLAREVSLRRIFILQKKNKKEEAKKLVASEIQRGDSSWEFYALASELEQDSGDLDSALRFLRDGREKHPNQGRLIFLEGACLEKMERYDEAMATMRDLIKIEPDNSSALNFLGYLIVERGGNLAEARRLIEKALKIRPGDGAYLDSLGWCLFKMGEVDKAEVLLRQAIEKSPKEGVIMEHLAEVALKKKQPAEAIQWLEKALQETLDPRDRNRIQKRFDQLKSKS